MVIGIRTLVHWEQRRKVTLFRATKSTGGGGLSQQNDRLWNRRPLFPSHFLLKTLTVNVCFNHNHDCSPTLTKWYQFRKFFDQWFVTVLESTNNEILLPVEVWKCYFICFNNNIFCQLICPRELNMFLYMKKQDMLLIILGWQGPVVVLKCPWAKP